MSPVLRVSKNYFLTIALIAGLSSVSRADMADSNPLSKAHTKVATNIPTKTPTKALTNQQVARYSVLRPRLMVGQQDLLSIAKALRVPSEITTVGGALEWVIKDSGYRLASPDQLTKDVKEMLQLPLPKAHRQFQAVPLRDVVLLLAGSSFVLVHDPVHRLIAFERCYASADHKGLNITVSNEKRKTGSIK